MEMENDGTPVGIDKVLTNQLIIDGFVHRVASASDETQLALEWWGRDGGNVASVVRCRGNLREFAAEKVERGTLVRVIGSLRQDGGHRNCGIGKLMCVTRVEHSALNRGGLRSADPELTETGLLVARLSVSIRRKSRERKTDGEEKI